LTNGILFCVDLYNEIHLDLEHDARQHRGGIFGQLIEISFQRWECNSKGVDRKLISRFTCFIKGFTYDKTNHWFIKNVFRPRGLTTTKINNGWSLGAVMTYLISEIRDSIHPIFIGASIDIDLYNLIRYVQGKNILLYQDLINVINSK